MQSFLKDIRLLPFQEWHSEMSHKQILTKLQFQKIYQCPLCCVAVWFRMNISAQHFLLCQLWFVIFQSTHFKKGNALFSNPIQMKNSGDVLEAVHNTSLTSARGGAKKVSFTACHSGKLWLACKYFILFDQHHWIQLFCHLNLPPSPPKKQQHNNTTTTTTTIHLPGTCWAS